MTEARGSGEGLIFVSVIVPVFNDGERLARCLAALEAQTYPAERFEVIVVDNGSEEDPAPLVARFPHARLCRESSPGSYAARNHGIAQARGPAIAFTDSDCIPRPDWLANGISRLYGDERVGLVAGAVEVFCRDPERPTAVELFECIGAFPQKRYVEEKHFGVTANVFTTRSVIEVAGPFDADLKSGGDYEWGQRVFGAGFEVVYAERAIVAHPARASWMALWRRNARRLAGERDLERKGRRSSPGLLRAILRDLAPRSALRFGAGGIPASAPPGNGSSSSWPPGSRALRAPGSAAGSLWGARSPR